MSDTNSVRTTDSLETLCPAVGGWDVVEAYYEGDSDLFRLENTAVDPPRELRYGTTAACYPEGNVESTDATDTEYRFELRTGTDSEWRPVAVREEWFNPAELITFIIRHWHTVAHGEEVTAPLALIE
ncbi:hypothetical protein RYH80_18785 [Halobaculum sp. MBLA0147]|uniref:hypothetical protein n=1 Tax=Halobaculum sp. MBLA0147 TaxID=3079934 RepID=UPI0035249EF0